jgi:hypothetical protein
MTQSHPQKSTTQVEDAGITEPPFFIAKNEEEALRIGAGRLNPSAVITQASSFDEYARQLLVPPTVMDLARKASGIRLSSWEIEGIRAQLEPASGGLLRRILEGRWSSWGRVGREPGGSVRVVVARVLGQDPGGVAFVVAQDAIGALAADGADESLGITVRPV